MRKFISLIFSLFITIQIFSQVPIIGAKLSDVKTNIEAADAGKTVTSLKDAIDNDALAGSYDDTYYTYPATSLKEFRNYDHTPAWDISGISFNQSFDLNSQDTDPQGIWIDSSGTRLYMVGDTNKKVYQYSMSPAWDISTISYVRDFSISSQTNFPQGVQLDGTGTKMYVAESAGINEYDLSTAWNISTASFSFYKDFDSSWITVLGFFISSDGINLGVVGLDTTFPSEYHMESFTMSTAWDISTVSHSTTENITSEAAYPNGIYVTPNNVQVFVADRIGSVVVDYSLTSSWDFGASFYEQEKSIDAEVNSMTGIFFRSDGLKMYVCDLGGYIYEYDF